MKKTTAMLFCLMILFGLALAVPARGQPSSFIIERADDSNTLSVAASSDLDALIAGVDPRFVVQYANANTYYDLVSIPAELDTLLANIGSRFVIQYANGNAYYELRPPPDSFQTLLLPMLDRFIIQYANANQYHTFSYPADLIGDTTPPQIDNLSSTALSEGNVRIAWDTDEFATSSVDYGAQTGVYTQTVAEALYHRQHEVVLTGLTSGNTYYYRISNTDRSGNTVQSSEDHFTVTLSVFLPVILRAS